MLYFFTVAAVVLGVAFPALAQDMPPAEPQQMEHLVPKVSDKLQQGQASYEAAVKKLTSPQQSALVELDKMFYASMRPIIEAYDMGGKLLFCLRKSSVMASNQQKFVEAFQAYRAKKAGEQEEMWKEHRKIAVKVDYLDHALLNDHYAYIQTAQISVVEQMVDRAGNTGGYNATNCKAVHDTLTDTASESENSPQDTFEGTFDEQGGSSGTPAK